ncbi:MAG: hypothetical protein AAF928_14315 [Myxococcota bacterium]
MDQPAVDATASPWSEPPPRRDRSARARRAVGQSITLLLVATFVVALLGGWPAVVGAIEADRPDAARPGLRRILRAREWAIGEPRVRDAGKYGPRMDVPRGHPDLETLEQLLDGMGAPNAGGLGWMGKSVTPRGTIALRDGPSPRSPTVLQATPSMRLIVLKDTGRWLMVAVRDEGASVIGWTPRDTVTPLP